MSGLYCKNMFFSILLVLLLRVTNVSNLYKMLQKTCNLLYKKMLHNWQLYRQKLRKRKDS